MKYSNIPSSVIAKYSHILAGIVFTTTSVMPLATSVMAQTAPALTVTGSTRTPVVPARSEVVYRIKVTNTTTSIAHKVKVTGVLPEGFTYGKHLTTLQKGAVTFDSKTKFLDTGYTTKPVTGQSTPLVWDKITIPASGSIEFIFTATASATPSTVGSSSSIQSLQVEYYNSSTSNSPLKNPTNALSIAAATATGDDVTIKPLPPTPTLSFVPSPNNVYDAPICAQPGAEGVGVELTGIVNTYFKPTLQSVAAGTNSIAIVSDAAKGATQDIKPGDLVLIVQMQDATINTENNANYGSGSGNNQGSGQISMGSTGLYEYAIATSTVLKATGSAAKTLTLRRPLINSYISAAKTNSAGQKRFQVIRVPQYASAKILGTMFAEPWDGAVGGILAADTFGTFDLNGQRLSVNEAGFRGGFGLKNDYLISAQEGFVAKTNVYGMDSLQNVLLNSDNSPQTTPTKNTLGSGKGEGVAGTPRFVSTKRLVNVDPINEGGRPNWTGDFIDNKAEGYPTGDTGRGAPANAGGGANGHNAGGGGGGNGGNGGQGSIGYGFTGSGYTSLIKDAGGRPGSSSLTHIPTPMKVFMGGGGGGGEANHAMQGVPGGAGGGIVMLRGGTIVGTGFIYANGAKGDRGAQGTNPDGAGGGGAGGTVLIQSRNPTSASITIEAKGGAGGSTEQDAFYNYKSSPVTNTASQTDTKGYSPDGYAYNQGQEPHGPGGGGAGGIVLYNVTSGATITPIINGGASGLTDDPSPDATLKPRGGKTQNSNGATPGSNGQIVPFSNSDDRFADLNGQTACSPANLSVGVSTSTQSAAPGDVVRYKVKVTNPASSGGATGVNIASQLPAGFTYTSTPANGIVLTGGATQSATATSGSTPNWGQFMIPPGATVEINFTATVGATVQNNVYPVTASVSFLNPLRTSDTGPGATFTESSGAQTGGSVTVRRRSVPQVWKLSPTIRIVRR